MPVELNRLEGEWVCRVSRSPAGPAWRRETWRPDGAGRLSGRIRVERSKPGRLMLVEDADVSIAGQSLIYHRFDGLMPYRLSRSDRNETVYEHAGSGNLRWISFRHQPGGASRSHTVTGTDRPTAGPIGGPAPARRLLTVGAAARAVGVAPARPPRRGDNVPADCRLRSSVMKASCSKAGRGARSGAYGSAMSRSAWSSPCRKERAPGRPGQIIIPSPISGRTVRRWTGAEPQAPAFSARTVRPLSLTSAKPPWTATFSGSPGQVR